MVTTLDDLWKNAASLTHDCQTWFSRCRVSPRPRWLSMLTSGERVGYRFGHRERLVHGPLNTLDLKPVTGSPFHQLPEPVPVL